ncbi:MAG: hypothetical protein H6555_11620 [Lewinellaceae bacterium]|nr:hypothetical protein [Lewinellaceae bacterium]
MNTRVAHGKQGLLILSMALLVTACQKEDHSPGGETEHFEQVYSWKCSSGQNCQDVFDFVFKKGMKVDFRVSNVTDGSVAQIALYAPGVALGGTNLFTGTTKELLCNLQADCSKNQNGQAVTSFTIPTDGTYRFAVSRNWGYSCGSTGNYRLMVHSSQAFKFDRQTADDEIAAVTETQCL